MAFSENVNIFENNKPNAYFEDVPFFYVPRFTNSGCFSYALAEIVRNYQKSSSLPSELAGSNPVRPVNNDENNGQVQFRRILQRPENYDNAAMFGAQPQNRAMESPQPQFPMFTRIVKRSANSGLVMQKDDGQAHHSSRGSSGEAQKERGQAPHSSRSDGFGGEAQKERGQFGRSSRGDGRNPGIRSKRDPTFSPQEKCAFCESNGETESYYTSHPLKDSQNLVVCPVLQRYTCPNCSATGQFAHTLKYCPLNPKPLPKRKPVRRNAVGIKRISYN